jgi:hypothetical protein
MAHAGLGPGVDDGRKVARYVVQQIRRS